MAVVVSGCDRPTADQQPDDSLEIFNETFGSALPSSAAVLRGENTGNGEWYYLIKAPRTDFSTFRDAASGRLERSKGFWKITYNQPGGAAFAGLYDLPTWWKIKPGDVDGMLRAVQYNKSNFTEGVGGWAFYFVPEEDAVYVNRWVP